VKADGRVDGRALLTAIHQVVVVVQIVLEKGYGEEWAQKAGRQERRAVERQR
jgi:hypothetical protein